MADSNHTRAAILDAAYVLFRRSGYARASLDEIARQAGVTKRTVYYHFESKDHLVGALLAEQAARALAAWRTYGDGLAGSPEEIVDRLFEGLVEWSSRPHWSGSGFTRLAVELADMPGHPARRIASEHKAALETMLADTMRRAGLDDAAARTREIHLLVEGAMVLTLIHADPAYAAAAAAAARRLVAAPAGSGAKA